MRDWVLLSFYFCFYGDNELFFSSRWSCRSALCSWDGELRENKGHEAPAPKLKTSDTKHVFHPLYKWVNLLFSWSTCLTSHSYSLQACVGAYRCLKWKLKMPFLCYSQPARSLHSVTKRIMIWGRSELPQDVTCTACIMTSVVLLCGWFVRGSSMARCVNVGALHDRMFFRDASV